MQNHRFTTGSKKESSMTAPNCTGEELAFEIDRFNKAVSKLFKRRNGLVSFEPSAEHTLRYDI